MNLLKKLFRRHGSSGSQAAGNDILFSPEDSRFQSLISLPEPIVHPVDMMEELGIAVCMHRKNSVAFGSEDIKAYEVLSPDDNKHLCFFLGMLKDGCYYGNIPGTSCICTCRQNDYVFKESKSFRMPVMIRKDRIYMLECCYDRKTFRVEADGFYKINRQDGNCETVLQFEGDDRRLNKAFSVIKDIMH